MVGQSKPCLNGTPASHSIERKEPHRSERIIQDSIYGNDNRTAESSISSEQFRLRHKDEYVQHRHDTGRIVVLQLHGTPVN